MKTNEAWLDSLGTRQEPAPEFPFKVQSALKARRRGRRAAGAGVAFLCVTVLAGSWMAFSTTGPRPPEIAQRPVTPRELPQAVPEPAGVTIASLYRELDAGGADSAALSGNLASDEPSLRIGDRWDPERVNAWVLN